MIHRCRVAFSESNGVEVSTVFLVVTDYDCSSDPVLFETMVFGGEYDGKCDRYTSYEEAEAGHAAMCATVWGCPLTNNIWPDIID